MYIISLYSIQENIRRIKLSHFEWKIANRAKTFALAVL